MKPAIQTCVYAAIAVILTISSLPVSAGKNHYRWLDERGNEVHSDRPPPKGIDYEVISTGSSLIRKVDAKEGAVPAEIEPRVGNEFKQIDTRGPELEKNPVYCKRAGDNLATLNSAPRVRVRNEQGEYHYLSDEERDAERQKAQSGIDMYCE